MFLRRRLGDGKASRRWDLLGVVVLAPKHRGAGISWVSLSWRQSIEALGYPGRRHCLAKRSYDVRMDPFGVALVSVVIRWMTRRGRRTPYRAWEGGEQAGSPRRRWPREGRRSVGRHDGGGGRRTERGKEGNRWDPHDDDGHVRGGGVHLSGKRRRSAPKRRRRKGS
jgi:hypothetical protein